MTRRAPADELAKASAEAARYIKAHGVNGMVLDYWELQKPEWLAIKARLDAALWPPPDAGPLTLFDL